MTGATKEYRFAVTGATGQLGRLVVDGLAREVTPSGIVALARSPARAADLGVAVREADYDRPDTLTHALEGVDTLLLISASEVGRREAQHRNVIEAARVKGVKRIVYTSLLHADASPLDSLATEHHATETALHASGIPHTVLRNGWYFENYSASINAALTGGVLHGCAGDGRISAAARADYAEAAVVVLTGDGHEGRTYELAGDESWTMADLAAEISRQSGRSIPYWNLSEAEYAAGLAAAGLPEGMARLIASWDTGVSEGGVFDDGRQLSRLIGRPTTSLAEFVAGMLG